MANGNIKYFLVGQNKFDYHFQIVEFEPEDFLYDTCKKLEQLDLFSSRFSSEDELVDFLYKKNKLPGLNYQLSIAFLKDKDVKFYNLIYNDGRSKHLPELISCAGESLEDTQKVIKRGKKIIKDFFNQVKDDDKLYDMLVSNATNIYGKFLEYFKVKGKFETFSDLQSMDGAWFLNSYTLLRNIVDAESHYQQLAHSSLDFYYIMNSEKREDERKKLKGKSELRKELLEKLDPLVLPGQLSLFDFDPVSNQYSVSRKASKGVILESDIPEPKIVIPVGEVKRKRIVVPNYSEVDDLDKRTAIFATLRLMSKNPFKMGDYNNIEFDPRYFTFPISQEQQEKLEKYMDRKTRVNCYHYIRYQHLIKDENEKGFSVCYELYEDRDAELRSLSKKLKNPTTLNKTYAWCVAFNECLVQQREYDATQEVSGCLENAEGYAYVKKGN